MLSALTIVFYLLFQVAKSVQEDETLYTWSQGYFQLKKMKTSMRQTDIASNETIMDIQLSMMLTMLKATISFILGL